MAIRATGTFDVKLAPLPLHEAFAAPGLGRMSIEKAIHGDLQATTRGEMTSAMTDVKGSAGYVAIERVTGSLHGREGTFVLQHSSTMARGVPRQSITVVPDSGTGQLVGLAGSFTIEIRDGEHFYAFEYELPPA